MHFGNRFLHYELSVILHLDDELLSLFKRDFVLVESFVKEFKQAGATQFGSGWVWLTVADGKLVVEKSLNAINPFVFGHIPILVADVWERAYYLDCPVRYTELFLEMDQPGVLWSHQNGLSSTRDQKLRDHFVPFTKYLLFSSRYMH